MLPASKAAESINSLVDVIRKFQENRPHLGPIHERRIQGLVDAMPADFKIVAECMQDGFLRNFDRCDKLLDQAATQTWPQASYELNIAISMLESFRFSDCLKYSRSLLDRRFDEPDFLYEACELLGSVGFYQTATLICDQLEKLNFAPSHMEDAVRYLSEKYAEFGISDDEVAEFATIASLPIKEHLANKKNFVYELTHEFISASYPETFAFIFHLDTDVENIVDISESVADALAEHEFSEATERHLAHSVWAFSAERIKYAS
jgi:hypothetical protein